MQTRTLILDKWFIDKDENNRGKEMGWDTKISDSAVPATVPSIIQQYFPEYHGVAFYWCEFTPTLTVSDTDRLILRFGGVDYKAEVWLNGYRLGECESGETPFSFDVTDALKGDAANLLTVRVVNPIDKDIDGLNLMNIPHRNKVIQKSAGSNLNNGGIWYGVTLCSVPGIYIEDKYFVGDIDTGRLSVTADIVSHAKSDTDVQLKLNVYRKTGGSELIASESFTVSIRLGAQSDTFSLTVPNVRLWSPDDPYLYRIELTLDSEFGEHTVGGNFGFREFLVKDGSFYLNRKKFFLRCSHTGNVFPIGQMVPVVPDHLRRDLIFAKSCGFNALRSIAGLLRPEQLDVADEIGLLIYEECLASWCMGYSEIIRSDSDEELAAEIEKRGLMPLGDMDKMLKRWDNATEGMIKRDRNHPSVVIWGLLNETRVSNIFKRAVAFLPKARALDKTRLILLNSGRWDVDFRIGSLSNPYSDKWENEWGADGTCLYTYQNKAEFDNICMLAGDSHFYGQSPCPKSSREYFRTMGTPERPIFFSENGIGPLFNVTEEYKYFKQYGARLDLEDASWVGYQSNRLEEDWERLGLASVFPAEMMLKESQRLNAEVRRELFDMVRSNPNIAGYSLTGLLDHGMCGEGLWSYWRRFKPEMFDAISDGWAPLRFCLFIPRCFYSQEEIEFEAVLANDSVLSSGTYTADFAIVGEHGTVTTFTESFMLDGSRYSVPITKRKLCLDLPSGTYSVIASLREGVAAANKLDFIVADKHELYTDSKLVYVHSLKPETEELLHSIGTSTLPFSGQTDGTVIIGDASAEVFAMAASAADSGAKVLLLDTPVLADDEKRSAVDIGHEYTISNRSDWLYHSEYVITHDTVFDGLGKGLVDYPRYHMTFPHHPILTDATPDYIICPGFVTGYYGVKMSYGMSWAISGFKKGRGVLILNSFDIENNIGHPTADRLLANLIGYINKL